MKITQCPECGARYKIQDESAKVLAGKSATCKKCRARFIVEFKELSTAEKIGAESENDSKKKKRRTKNEIYTENLADIKSGFRTLHSRLVELDRESKSSEEDIRRWVLDVLRTVLGYDDSEIGTEEKVHDRKVDIVIRPNGETTTTFIYELKNIRRSLNSRVVDQATSYASGLSSKYAVVTNGAVWRFFELVCGTDGIRRLVEVFDVALLDDDGVSDEDAEKLYLLSKRSIEIGDTKKTCHQVAAMNGTRILNALLSDDVIVKISRKIEKEYMEETNVRVKLDPEEFSHELQLLFSPDTL